MPSEAWDHRSVRARAKSLAARSRQRICSRAQIRQSVIRGCVFWILLFPTNITLFNFVLGALAWLWVPALVRSDDHEYVKTLKLATPREGRYGREITNHGSCGS